MAIFVLYKKEYVHTCKRGQNINVKHFFHGQSLQSKKKVIMAIGKYFSIESLMIAVLYRRLTQRCKCQNVFFYYLFRTN